MNTADTADRCNVAIIANALTLQVVWHCLSRVVTAAYSMHHAMHATMTCGTATCP